MKKQRLPKGWTEKQIKDVLRYYETQTEEEQVAEHEAAHKHAGHAMMAIPIKLVPAVRELIARKSSA